MSFHREFLSCQVSSTFSLQFSENNRSTTQYSFLLQFQKQKETYPVHIPMLEQYFLPQCCSYNNKEYFRESRDYGSNKKRCRCFFTDSCKNFCIHICNKASHQSRKKNISPEFFSQKEHQPAKEAANCCQRQIFLFYMKKNSKSCRANGSGN